MDEVGVLAEPSNAGPAGKVTLEQRASVDVTSCAYRRSDLAADPGVQRVELSSYHIVIVVAACVARDRSGWRRAPVIQCNDYGADTAGEWQPAIPPCLGVARQVRHGAGSPVLDPSVEMLGRIRRARSRDADEIEAEAKRLRLDRRVIDHEQPSVHNARRPMPVEPRPRFRRR